MGLNGASELVGLKIQLLHFLHRFYLTRGRRDNWGNNNHDDDYESGDTLYLRNTADRTQRRNRDNSSDTDDNLDSNRNQNRQNEREQDRRPNRGANNNDVSRRDNIPEIQHPGTSTEAPKQQQYRDILLRGSRPNSRTNLRKRGSNYETQQHFRTAEPLKG